MKSLKIINLECPADSILISFGKTTHYKDGSKIKEYNGEEFKAEIAFNDQLIMTLGKEIFNNSGDIKIAHSDLIDHLDLESGDLPLDIKISKKSFFGYWKDDSYERKMIQVRKPGESYLTWPKQKPLSCCKYTCLDFEFDNEFFLETGNESSFEYRLDIENEKINDDIITTWTFSDIYYIHEDGESPVKNFKKTFTQPAIFWRDNIKILENNYTYKLRNPEIRNPRLKTTETSFAINVYELNCDGEDKLVEVKEAVLPSYADHFIDMSCAK